LAHFQLLDKPVGLTDWAYEQIKEAILKIQFAPGSQLQIETLVAELGTSRTPIREALLRLEKDGLVRVVPRVGFFVKEFTYRDLEELYEVRELLESRAVKNAVGNLSDEDLDLIDQILDLSVTAVQANDVDKFLEIEIQFHNLLTEHSQNAYLISVLESLRDLSYRWRMLSLRSYESFEKSMEEHLNIARAVRNKDAELASQLMAEHLRNACQRIMEIVKASKGTIDDIHREMDQSREYIGNG
jgi:DNA-binding GntR family transcriptional regulator